MQFIYNNKEYEIVIEKKSNNRNTYIRVKNDLKIHVTTTWFTSNRYIKNLINDNVDKICKMIDLHEAKVKNNEGFYYLGKQYEIVYKEQKGITFSDDKVYMSKDFDIDKWYKKEAKKLFIERLDYIYNKFTRKIPYPKIKIRKMTTRWGSCNIQTHDITLNLNLMKRDIKYLDYVIVHELTHLVHGDHSNRFWKVVEENMPDYKKYKEEMKEF